MTDFDAIACSMAVPIIKVDIYRGAVAKITGSINQNAIADDRAIFKIRPMHMTTQTAGVLSLAVQVQQINACSNPFQGLAYSSLDEISRVKLSLMIILR